jgi:large subunit ribosomal protein L6
MSRIGTKIITIPENMTVNYADNRLECSGPNGTNEVIVHPRITVVIEDNTIKVTRHSNDRIARSLHGLSRVLIANSIEGAAKGFTKRLEMQGIGYRAQTDGKTITLNVGYTHPVTLTAPDGITFSVEKNTLISVSGKDKQSVGQVAANIRKVRKPEPYKGKGIRYEGELVRRKVGKAAKAGK